MPALNQLRLKATRTLSTRSPTDTCRLPSSSFSSFLRPPQLSITSPFPSVSYPSVVNHPPTAKMSTMPASHGHNEACCNIPPVVSTGYSPKGTYEEVDGLKTYVTGPADATKGIVVIYDIFGYFDQTVQGADILAISHHEKYKVFIPDWFEGEPCPIEWYPPNTEEKQKSLGAFFGKNPPPGVAAKLPAFVKALGAKNPSIKSWGVLGFCWGGKVVSLVTSGSENPFVVGAECHPAMVDPKEAEGIKIPLILLASKEEPDDKVKQFEENLKVSKHVETFKDQIHGWMAARADLSDARVKEEYARGYKTVLDFFAKNWS
ncbi:hypothetical protein QBC38DRAFT_477692 [Podospora fimiseda]|uniref:Dienelactone hydrolase domain-containing protein n=1 Tax=Podospora fimiseda TaxID=252190 RepID=A0AAN7GZ90_9PEZI|nr:hypothetical protein QBC38DRAFT_477692 [Podospora fimiseda]